MAAHDSAYASTRIAVDHVVQQLSRDRTLSTADKAAYRSVACGAIMTFARAAKLGYLVLDRCPLCGAEGDTLRHRVWRCQLPAAVAARDNVAPEWLQREEQHRGMDESFWVNGFIPHPADVWPAPQKDPEAACEYGAGTAAEMTGEDGVHSAPRLRGRLFGDGSCTTHVFPDLRRAATAIVQRRPDGGRGWTVQCTVPPPLTQTPQAAEFIVLAIANQL